MAVALLFVGAQIFTLSHAAAYGPGEHDHGGGACQIQIIAKGMGGIVDALPMTDPPTLAAASHLRPWHDTARPHLLTRLTRIRAPPRIPS